LCEICNGPPDLRLNVIVLRHAVAKEAYGSHGDHADNNPDLPTLLHVYIPRKGVFELIQSWINRRLIRNLPLFVSEGLPQAFSRDARR